MRTRKRWSDVTQRQRTLLLTAAGAEGVLKIAALIDMKNRPASQIRGPKWLWATSVTIIGSAGTLPLCYFLFGRRLQTDA